jgi:UDP-N-acetylmuramoylalanine--D-glutamate ligase
MAEASSVLPSPGIGDTHVALDLAREMRVPVRSEFDLAADWDSRPVLAITGTDGKTTVTTLVTEMLLASGVRATAAGNNELPLVAAIDDPMTDVFVVEASSFRLDHSERFAPHAGTWLNFAPDHLNLHRSLDAYEQAKARLWRDQSADDVAIGNADDAVVMRHLYEAPARHVTFGLGDADYRVEAESLVADDGTVLAELAELWRAFPHDLSNALAAAATARAGGATTHGVHDALRSFSGLAHRIQLVGQRDGIDWYDDSKATTPNAAAAALRSFESVVLIAGGQNKGLDLSVLAREAGRIRAVVAIGEAAGEVEHAFNGVRSVVVAESMSDAVGRAAALARSGDTVLLSPACASFDWYKSYGERGDDFAARVRDVIGASR